MALFSAVIALIQAAYLSEQDEKKPFMHGFTFWVWMIVIFQAGGGLLVAAVIKYGDNVLKGLATGVSVVVATFCTMILFKTALSIQFAFGAVMILAPMISMPNFFLCFLILPARS